MAAIKRTPDLEDDQKFALMKFRRSVQDLLRPEHDDYFLCRWLRARKWNTEAAEKMFRESMKFRTTWNFDEIDKWDKPQILKDYVPHGICGYDKEGSPIVIIPFAGMDMWGMLHCVTSFEFFRSTVQILEGYMKVAYEQSKIHGPQARQFVVLFDMDNFYLKQYAWRPAAEVVITLVKNYELNYPEILKMCYIINAPKIFSVAFNIIKKFLDEYTMSKINIYNSGSEKWKPKLFSHIDPSQFPKYWGGTMTDADGDPKCKSKICWGGRIPKDMYNKQDDNNNDDLTEVVVNKGQKLKLPYECTVPGSLLKWEFKTIDYDIKFGVKCTDNKTGQSNYDVPMTKVYSHEMDEIGFITCKDNCKYEVVFDNSGSFLRSKKLKYSIAMSPPLSDLETSADQMVENLTHELQGAMTVQ